MPTYSRPKTGSVEILAAHREAPTSRSPRRFNRVTSGAFRPQYRVDALTTPASDTPRATASSWTRCTTVCGTNGPPCSEPSTSTRSPGPASRTFVRPRPTPPTPGARRPDEGARAGRPRPQSSVSVTRASRAISSGATARTSSCGRSTATVSPPANRTRAARNAATWNDRPSATVHDPRPPPRRSPGRSMRPATARTRRGARARPAPRPGRADPRARGCRSPAARAGPPRTRPLRRAGPARRGRGSGHELARRVPCLRHASKGTAVLGRSDGAWPRRRTQVVRTAERC